MNGKLTVFTASNPRHLGKVFHLEANGYLRKETAGELVAGSYETRPFGCATDLVKLLTGVGTNQAITTSICVDGDQTGLVTTRKGRAGGCKGVTRTKDCFNHPHGQPGVLTLDYDPHGTALTQEALWKLLTQVVSGVATTGVVWWCSGSSHIYDCDHELQGLRGQRLYLLVKDIGDTERAGRVLSRRLWLADHGRVEVSKAGSLLVRSVFDDAMHQPARLDFIGGSVTLPPLTQRRGLPVILSEGGWLDTRVALPDLTDEESGRYEALVAQAKDMKAEAAAAVRAVHRSAQIAEQLPLMMAQGMSAAIAEQRVGMALDAAFGGVLLGDFRLSVIHDDGSSEEVTVEQVLAQRDRYHEQDCLDPLNPSHRGGSPDARLYLNSASPVLFSLDDGGVVFRLRRQSERILSAKGARGELVEAIVRNLLSQDDVFITDAGPVQVVGGRVLPLTALRLQNLVGSRVVLVTRSADGRDCLTDLTKEVADLALAAMNQGAF